MTWLDWTAHLIAALIFMIGLLTVLLPVIPGSVIVWLGILIHKLWMGDASVGWGLVAITGALTAFGLLGDFLLGYWGAKIRRDLEGRRRCAVGRIGGIFPTTSPLLANRWPHTGCDRW